MSEAEFSMQQQVWDALRDVIDPEIGLDIVTLGLVYDVEVFDGLADVTFTLTTPGCPMERVIRGGIEHAVARVPGIDSVYARLVWEPRWNPTFMKEGSP